jgi:hypothetical protein
MHWAIGPWFRHFEELHNNITSLLAWNDQEEEEEVTKLYNRLQRAVGYYYPLMDHSLVVNFGQGNIRTDIALAVNITPIPNQLPSW